MFNRRCYENKKMNILIAASDFKPLIGGVAEHTFQIARVLSQRGNKVVVLTPHFPGDKEFDSICPYRVYRYNVNLFYSFPRLCICRYLKEFSFLKKIIDEYQVDIVIGNHLCINPYIYYWIGTKMMKRPFVYLSMGMRLWVDSER